MWAPPNCLYPESSSNPEGVDFARPLQRKPPICVAAATRGPPLPAAYYRATQFLWPRRQTRDLAHAKPSRPMPLPSTLLSDLETEARNHLSTGTYIASPRPGGLFLSNPNASMRLPVQKATKRSLTRCSESELDSPSRHRNSDYPPGAEDRIVHRKALPFGCPPRFRRGG